MNTTNRTVSILVSGRTFLATVKASESGVFTMSARCNSQTVRGIGRTLIDAELNLGKEIRNASAPSVVSYY